jgi:hypothetical protein
MMLRLSAKDGSLSAVLTLALSRVTGRGDKSRGEVRMGAVLSRFDMI